MSTFITNVRLFDGEHVRSEQTVGIEGTKIVSLGQNPPSGAEVVDGRGGTLLPGLIDGHVHTSLDGLRLARVFGVTTELEMQGYWTPQQRKEINENDDIADVRSALLALMAKDGHPHELIAELDEHRPGGGGWTPPSVSTPDEAVAHVQAMAAQGADYIKVMIEEGTVMGHPGLPLISTEALKAGVAEAHRLGKKVIAHAMTLAATEQAVEVGVDGLAHLFIDRAHTEEIVTAIADAGIFVTPCLVISSSVMGATGQGLADDPRVGPKLPQQWLATLRGTFNKYPDGILNQVLASVAALHSAGVDIIAGTDASIPVPAHGGVVHGASVHHELQLLVEAGLTPLEALRAATSVPARRFGLDDRGRIAPGARADLVLVDGDPTTRVQDSLSIRAIWRRGAVSTD
ncbi:amidohydrolase family protein [Streptantibioticus ferralitis]|uniref:Amidohydrolase family protein n=1 Tax=Streptantibioticus ferralitis TaxID=236510 RepID=A0ABT5ZBD0_9ACTN|nr:amidohydrolase family protein [Streptantibioticus ferralitis]MDF2261149.1 amidohydrolase family protein [Streptantibioticus ferralitis]